MRKFSQFSPPFVQSSSFSSETETQKQEALGTARTKSQGGGTCEERSVLREQGVQMPRREQDENNHHQMLENLASCRLWSLHLLPFTPPSRLLPPAPASSGGGGSHAWPHTACKAPPPGQTLGTKRTDSSPFELPPPPSGSFVSMTTATPWHPVGTVTLSHRSKLMSGECSSVVRREEPARVTALSGGSCSQADRLLEPSKPQSREGGWEIFLIVASSVFHFPHGSNRFLVLGKVKKYTLRHAFIFSPTMLSCKCVTLWSHNRIKSKFCYKTQQIQT